MAPPLGYLCVSHRVSVSFRIFPEKGFPVVRGIRKSVSLLLIDCTFCQTAYGKEFLLSLEMCRV